MLGKLNMDIKIWKIGRNLRNKIKRKMRKNCLIGKDLAYRVLDPKLWGSGYRMHAEQCIFSIIKPKFEWPTDSFSLGFTTPEKHLTRKIAAIFQFQKPRSKNQRIPKFNFKKKLAGPIRETSQIFLVRQIERC